MMLLISWGGGCELVSHFVHNCERNWLLLQVIYEGVSKRKGKVKPATDGFL